uniref:Uncharacterized protein n=1 Tax=Sus scrofa TaxID=9823 RepID=A0A8D1WQQ6_PIG
PFMVLYWPHLQHVCYSSGCLVSFLLFRALCFIIVKCNRNRKYSYLFSLSYLAAYQLPFNTHEIPLGAEKENFHETFPHLFIFFFVPYHGVPVVAQSNNPTSIQLQMWLGPGVAVAVGKGDCIAEIMGHICSIFCVGASLGKNLDKSHVENYSWELLNPWHMEVPRAITIFKKCSISFHSTLHHYEKVNTQLAISFLGNAVLSFLIHGGWSLSWSLFLRSHTLALSWPCFEVVFFFFLLFLWAAPVAGIFFFCLEFPVFLPWLHGVNEIKTKE